MIDPKRSLKAIVESSFFPLELPPRGHSNGTRIPGASPTARDRARWICAGQRTYCPLGADTTVGICPPLWVGQQLQRLARSANCRFKSAANG